MFTEIIKCVINVLLWEGDFSEILSRISFHFVRQYRRLSMSTLWPGASLRASPPPAASQGRQSPPGTSPLSPVGPGGPAPGWRWWRSPPGCRSPCRSPEPPSEPGWPPWSPPPLRRWRTVPARSWSSPRTWGRGRAGRGPPPCTPAGPAECEEVWMLVLVERKNMELSTRIGPFCTLLRKMWKFSYVFFYPSLPPSGNVHILFLLWSLPLPSSPHFSAACSSRWRRWCLKARQEGRGNSDVFRHRSSPRTGPPRWRRRVARCRSLGEAELPQLPGGSKWRSV